jgi:hypothetical protein
MSMTYSRLIIAMLIIAVLAVTFSIARAASFPDPRTEVTKIASTTTITLAAGASVRIIATSTTPGARVALSLQAINCAATGYVSINYNDVSAVTGTANAIYGSSTPTVLGDTLPMAYGSIQASGAVAGCTLLVTQFRATP